jgi:hypothetical protein
MTPSFSDFFKSFYYSNTYVPPVDLSEQALSKHLLESEDAKTAKIAQELISPPEVQSLLSEPLTYQPTEWLIKNKILTDRGFKLLSVKPISNGQGVQKLIPFYSVIEHENLPGLIIKAGATRVQKGQLLIGPLNDRNEMAFFTEEESLLRIEMANRIAKVAKKASIDVVLPKKKLVTYKNLDGVTEATRKYCVVCEKIDILSVDETVDTIKAMNKEKQKEVAQKISTIVQKAGLTDASFHNIRLTPEGKLAFIDTEPAGLMVAKKTGAKGASVEKCARIGLFTLMHQTSKATRGTATSIFDQAEVDPGLEAFRAQVESDYKKVSTPKLSKWKIGLSILSLGLVPLVNVIVALVKSHLTKKTFKKLQSSFDQPFILNSVKRSLKSQEEQMQLTKEYQEKRTPTAKKFFAYIEGVPYTADI